MEEIPITVTNSNLPHAPSSVNISTSDKPYKRKLVDSENSSNPLPKAQKQLPTQSPKTSLKSMPDTSSNGETSNSISQAVSRIQNKSSIETLKQPEATEDIPVTSTKVPNQVPIQTFWGYVEEYFRNFTENDIEFLQAKGEKSEPFIIPPFGKFYREKWKDEDEALSHKIEMTNLLETKNFDTFHVANVDLKNWNEIQCPTLNDRILSSLLNENLVDLSDSDSEESRLDSPVSSPTKHHELVDIDERLRRDLRHLGILADEDIDSNAHEDNEICTTLRSLQSRLREQISVNELRKEQLEQVVHEHTAYQEYLQILNELDKQIEQAYIKRVKSLKSKKKKISSKGLSENLIALMDRRKQYVDGIGSVFPKEMFTSPAESIYPVPNDSHSTS
ncbi:hypothetical protein K493DRAFT_281372 [Basidiobolus meristosporus CBS 931.73]|uniref:Histone acetyltransferases subunit 3 n=1 Tax=Basidiobolus meristosporus CBS 931.73 TaxID=1314790 RepID=A0A1Y1YGY4_9FUNG|nr:hypothetical protein K493DRAFT_281372 [Basidiobolus meristosporus CBS 931.73]|eukprot:ORX97257.1 hypothetical protein K493DRAFT_281372 [Basidiobolus meristosporus CBS 931.73]